MLLIKVDMAVPSTAEWFLQSTYQVEVQTRGNFSIRACGPDGSLILFGSEKELLLKQDIHLFSDEDKTQEIILLKAEDSSKWRSTYSVVDAMRGAHLGVFTQFGGLFNVYWTVRDASNSKIGSIKEDGSIAEILTRRFLLLGSAMPFLALFIPLSILVAAAIVVLLLPGFIVAREALYLGLIVVFFLVYRYFTVTRFLADRLLRRDLRDFVSRRYRCEVGAERVCTYQQELTDRGYRLKISFPESPRRFDGQMGLAGAILLAAIPPGKTQ